MMTATPDAGVSVFTVTAATKSRRTGSAAPIDTDTVERIIT
jgi:hypothetical protein